MTNHLTVITNHLTVITNDPADDGSLPDDPQHPTIDDAPRYALAAPHTADVRHDASDEFQTITARAVYVSDGLTGSVVELGPWSLEAADAHRLGTALRTLAAAAEPRLAGA